MSRWAMLSMLILLLAVPATAQDEEFVPAEEELLEAPSEEEQADFEAIDDLLLQDEEILADPGTYSYDPGARRDPFRSLIQQREQEPAPTERPPGVAGLLIDEIQLEGVFVLADGPVAQVVSASQETSFLLEVGQELWDGEVVSISTDQVVFRQTVDDPTARKPFRDVVKKLSPES